MTIFIQVVKALMIKCLDNLVAASNSKDAGMLQWRNKELSQAQRGIVLKLRADIDGFNNNDEKQDKDCVSEIKSMILEAAKLITTKRRDAGHADDGDTKTGLLKINTHLDMFYNSELERPKSSFNFLDIPYNINPFNIYSYHGLYYLGENIFMPQEDGVFKRSLGLFSGSSTAEIRMKKEDILIKNLIKCKTHLNALKDDEEYQEIRKAQVVGSIEQIQRENAALCQTTKVGTEIPVTLNLFAAVSVGTPTVKASRGRLEDEMSLALDAINSPSATIEKKH